MADLRTEQQIRQELEAQRALMNDLSRGANLRKSDSKRIDQIAKTGCKRPLDAAWAIQKPLCVSA